MGTSNSGKNGYEMLRLPDMSEMAIMMWIESPGSRVP